MPLQKLQFRPGINREGTTLSNEGGWYDCDKVRFRSGFPEKIGGWTVVSYNTFLGICRSLWNWVTLKSYNIVGVGTDLKFYVQNGGSYYDITPIKVITGAGATPPTASPTFSTGVTTLNGGINASTTTIVITSGTNFPTTNGRILIDSEQITYATRTGTTLSGCVRGAYGTTAASHSNGASVRSYLVIVSDANTSGIQQNDFVTFTGVATVGGLDLNKEFQMVSVISGTSYVIDAGAAATSTVTGGGGAATTAYYQINTGYPIYTVGTGWGTGPWSRGTWGSGYSTTTTSTSGLQLRLWSQANFGEDLLFTPRGGALYIWQPGAGGTPAYGTRGTLVTGVDVPSTINSLIVADSSRIVIAFGCNDYGVYASTPLDPLLIRWSAQENYTDWSIDPLGQTQAGSYRLSRGSYIVGSLQTRQEILVWTDAAIYSMQYLGPPYVYGFTLLADNISIASPNAMVTASGVTYWMGVDKFYIYSGRVETLPCSVRTYVYNDINMDQAFQFFAGTNEAYSEVWWYYCSKNSLEIDRYVIFNYLDRVWYYGELPRTAWLDSPLLPFPLAATVTGLLVYHEAAVDDGTTNPPSPISSYVQTSDFDIGDGHNYGFVWQIVPDITFDGSTTPAPNYPTVTFTVRPRRNPGSNYGTSDEPSVTSTQSYAGQTTYNVQQFTQVVNARLRGRQMAFRVSSDTLGTQWQLGTPRLNVRPDGRK